MAPTFFWFTLWNPAFSQVATLENLRCFATLKKKVYFTGLQITSQGEVKQATVLLFLTLCQCHWVSLLPNRLQCWKIVPHPHIHVCLQFVEMTTDHVSIMRYHVPIVINGSYHLNYPRHLSPKTTSAGTPAAISSLTCGHLMVLKTSPEKNKKMKLREDVL